MSFLAYEFKNLKYPFTVWVSISNKSLVLHLFSGKQVNHVIDWDLDQEGRQQPRQKTSVSLRNPKPMPCTAKAAHGQQIHAQLHRTPIVFAFHIQYNPLNEITDKHTKGHIYLQDILIPLSEILHLFISTSGFPPFYQTCCTPVALIVEHEEHCGRGK